MAHTLAGDLAGDRWSRCADVLAIGSGINQCIASIVGIFIVRMQASKSPVALGRALSQRRFVHHRCLYGHRGFGSPVKSGWLCW